ncbi:hypothetical protein [uncultured Pontibacter sp.]|uniref:hypothetical protein n=1 Tax=uncultured Pontibacter sp. TaxID=453356 RepID=UPI00262B0F8A|nr:hypothetical protein [uncultured Pontibacter sp.]
MSESDIIVVAEDDFYRVEVHEKPSLLYVHWKCHLEGDILKDKFLMLLKLIDKFKPERWLGNAKATYYTTIQDARWLLEEFIPVLVKSSVLRYARVETANSLLLLDSLNLQEKLRSRPPIHSETFEFRYFTDEAQAYTWLTA